MNLDSTHESTSYALVALKWADHVTLARAVLQINATRQQRIAYTSLILSAPQGGWVLLLLGDGQGAVDHMLMRNLSGRLATMAFEARVGEHDFAYRLHAMGHTESAFESNLTHYINQRVRTLERTRNVDLLDLGEPIERFVMKRYRELQQPDPASTLSLTIPEVLQAHYKGDAQALSAILKPDIEVGFVSGLLAPGFSPQRAFELLLQSLKLPYLGEVLTACAEDGQVLAEAAGLSVLQPVTWSAALPAGWRRIPALPEGLAPA
ncbi:MAG: hypothetical protein Kow0077_07980 [Anaerolineae bacterium]